MEFQVVVLLIGALVLAVGVTADALKRVWLSAPLIAVGIGVVVGPELTGIVKLEWLGEPRKVLKDLAELTLAVALTATALQISRSDLRENLGRAGALLTLGMVGMFAVTSLGAWLLLDLPFWGAVLVGAILTPTDPVVASALVTGPLAERHLPRWLRRSLQIESGANDGLAIAFVLLPVIVVTQGTGAWLGEAGQALGVGLGIGLVTGYLVGRAVSSLHRSGAYGDEYVLAVGVGLALVNVAGGELLGGSGILAAFVSALVFSELLHEEAAGPLERMQGAVEKLFILPVFALFGLLLPWDAWAGLGVGGLAFAAWVLLLRRPPVVGPALAATTATGRRGATFLGWFGPLGVAAMYYVTFIEEYDPARYETVFAACTLAIAASIVAHSVSATPWVRRFGRG